MFSGFGLVQSVSRWLGSSRKCIDEILEIRTESSRVGSRILGQLDFVFSVEINLVNSSVDGTAFYGLIKNSLSFLLKTVIIGYFPIASCNLVFKFSGFVIEIDVVEAIFFGSPNKTVVF